jgi:tetratricopeptide (TPR) repeat protein
MAEAWPRAVQYLVLAGECSRELFANADAIRHYSEALALLEKMVSAEDPSRWPQELAAHEGLAEVHARLGDYPAAVAAYGRALTCAYLLQMEPHDRYLRTAAIKRKTAKCLFETGSEKRAEQLLREAFRVVRPFGDPEVRTEQSAVLADLGFLRWRSGRYLQAMRFGRWSCRLAVAAGAELQMGAACNLLGLSAGALGRFDEAAGHYQRVLHVAERTGDVATVGTVLNNLGNLFSERARLDEAESYYERAERQWRKMGDVVRLATTLSNVGNVHLARGEFERAAQALQSAIQMFRRANLPFEEAAALAVLGEASLECGRVVEAVQSLTGAQALAEALSVPDLMAYIGSVLAVAYVEQEDLEQAERECRRALTLAEGIACAPGEGAIRRTLARIGRLRGEISQADVELARAQAIFASNDLELGRTLVELSRLLVCTERRDAAAARLTDALELFRRSGAHADQVRTEALLQELRP